MRTFAAWAVFAATIAAANYARADIAITKIADTNTSDPSSSGDFTSFGIPSSDRDNYDYQNFGVNDVYPYNNVFFTAQGPNGLSGVYQAYFPGPGITEIFPIADTTMTAQTGGQFASFSNTSSGWGEVGFIATDSNGVQGIYQDTDDIALALVASSNTSPSSGGTFGHFQSVSAMSQGFFSENLPPEGEIESDAGVYTFTYTNTGLSYSLIANTSTIPSGASTPFSTFGPVSYKTAMPGSNIAGYHFAESAVLATVNNVQGIYISLNTTFFPPHKLVDTNSPAPNGTGTFTSFGNPIATSTYIEFTASYSSLSGPQQGIFVYGPYLIGNNAFNEPQDIPTLQEFLASGAVAPDSNGAHFASFLAIGNNENLNGYSIAENYNIPFLATLDDGVEGLFCTTGIGTSVKILDTGDTLDGQTVASIELSPDCAGGVFTVFEVGFTDGSSGIFYFNTNVLPENGSLSLLIPIAGLLRRRTRL